MKLSALILCTMAVVRTLLLCASAACGVVEVPEPTDVGDQPAIEPAIESEIACAAMDCDVLIGESCPVCGKPELTCACFKLRGDGRDEIGVPCSPPPGSMTCR